MGAFPALRSPLGDDIAGFLGPDSTLESFYKHFAATVGGITTSPDESLRELDARHYRREHYRLESLNAELAEIEKKISREVQLDRKHAPAEERMAIEREAA